MTKSFRTLLCCCLLCTCLLCLLPAVAIPAAGTVQVLRLADRQTVELPQLLQELAPVRYLFLAENHNDAWHHDAQLALIRGLSRQGRSLAIGLEMFTSASQEQLDLWNSGSLSPAGLRRLFEQDWKVPWELYRDIFLFARDNRIPLVGLNLPHELSHKVSRSGFASLTPAERRFLPANVTCSVSPAYMAFIRQAYASHGMDERAFSHFCEAQLLWNRFMAEQLRRAAARYPQRTLVVLLGVGHALKKGVPEETGFEAAGYRVVLPEFPGLNRSNLTSQDGDYLLLSPIAD